MELALSFDPEFSILVSAVAKAGLAKTLAKGGTFNVFAPTNQAFIALQGELGLSSLDELLSAIGTEGLKNVLLYHVVSGCVYSSDLVSGPVTTLNGTFTVNVADLTITDAKGRESNLIPQLLNVQATNGVVRVIDRVMLP